MNEFRTSEAACAPIAPPTRPASYLFDSETLAPHQRFDAYREEVGRRFMTCEVERLGDGEFEARFEAFPVGEVVFGSVRASPAVYSRPKHLLAGSGETVGLYVFREGQLSAQQGKWELEATAGAGVVFCRGVEAQNRLLSRADAWFVSIPCDFLARSLQHRHAPRPTPLRADAPLTRLIGGYVASFAAVAPAPDNPLRGTFATHIADLVALACGAGRDEREIIVGRGLKAARAEAVLKAIARGFADPKFSAEQVALDLGLTPRQVHRLIEETPKTFSEHVLEHRLLRANEMLGDPAWNAVTVADIAAKAGFADVTSFNRAFRTRFGETPTARRTSAVRRRVVN
jgi:AraC-like DNA-binding protein